MLPGPIRALAEKYDSVPAELNDRRKSWREAEFAPSGGLSHNLLHHSNLEPAVQFLWDTTRIQENRIL